MRAMIFAMAGALFISAAPALAQNPEEAVADVLACEAVRGSKARLRCVEAALPALRAAHPGAVALAAERADAARLAAAQEAKDEFGLSPAQQQEQKTAAAEVYERESFGDDDLKKDQSDEDEVDRVSGVAVEIGKNNRGKIFVILDNGQVWRQIDADSRSPYIPRNAEGLPVEIKKGALGSYFVKVGNAKESFKANRIK